MNTQFFTGSGDDGLVKFGVASKKKSDQCFHTLGLCDEINVFTGYAAESANEQVKKYLFRIQELLFIVQAELATVIFGGEKKIVIHISHIEELEQMIIECDKQLEKINTFIIPRGSESALRIEIARVRAREFERVLIGLVGEYEISNELKTFSNRLSSVFFALARYENHIRGIEEKCPIYK